jgi:ABC-type transporter Mla maintaining outer membrane lipid asymmetry ATPase subunit MlaF
MDAAVEADQLSVAGPAGERLAGGISFRVAAGEALVLQAGPEVAAALVRAVMGIDPPAAGTVRVLGGDPWSGRPAALAALRARVGFLPRQSALLANLTLRENLLLPWRFHRAGRGDGAEATHAALSVFGLDEVPDLRPERVSIGVQRRVALARAILLDPELLVLHDPLDDLIDEEAAELAAALARWRAGSARAILAVTPRQGLATALAATTSQVRMVHT